VAFWNSLFQVRKNLPVETVRHRTMIVSVPKSGTYMYGKLLENFGLQPSRLHFADNGASFTDYRSASKRESHSQYTKLEIYKPFAESVWLLNPAQFAVGHLACTPEIQQVLANANYKVIVTVRDLRAAVVSLMRFQIQAERTTAQDQAWLALEEGPRRTQGFLQSPTAAWFFQVVRSMIPWLTAPDRLLVSFERLYGDCGREQQLAEACRIYEHLGFRRPGICQAALKKTIGADTLTYSGERTELAKFWNHEVEADFVRLGGAFLQEQYGYLPSWKYEYSQSPGLQSAA
jgi:hypothetical protein